MVAESAAPVNPVGQPVRCMGMSSPRRFEKLFIVSAVAGAVIMALVACSPNSNTGGPTGSDDPAGSGAAMPTSLLSIACADLVPLDDIRGALGNAVAPDDYPTEPGGSWPLTQVGLVQAGALRCHWSDAADQQGDYVANLEVTALANAASSWGDWKPTLASWAPAAAFGDESFGQCTSSLGGSYRYCTYDILVGGTWLYIAVQNLGDPALAEPVVAAVADALAGATSAPGTWTPPASSLSVPATCDELVTASEVNAILGTSGVAPREFPLNQPILYNVGHDTALACSWVNDFSSAQAMPVDITVLPGAGWAWETEWARPRIDSNPAAAHAKLGDAAFSGCTTREFSTCFVDVLADGAWITVSGNAAASIDGLAALAQHTLDALGYATAP